MPVEYTLQQTQQAPLPEQHKHPTRYLVMVGIIIVFVTLLLGILLGFIFAKPKTATNNTGEPTPSPSVVVQQSTGNKLSPTPVPETIPLTFLPGKQYFDDTYIVVETKAPHKALLLSVSRLEQQQGFSEFTKVNYFNGDSWERYTLSTTTQSGNVTLNSLLRLWNDVESLRNDPTTLLASVQAQKKVVSFSAPDLSDEISVQSLPGSTKFIYQGKGVLHVDSDIFDAQVLRSKTYSFNASDLSFLANPESLTSNFLVTWDTEGTFYYADSHNTPNASNKIQNFQLGVLEEYNKKVTKSLQVSSGVSNNESGKQYQATLQDPLNTRITIPMNQTVEKSPSQTYSWIIGVGDAQVVKSEGRIVGGYGLFEFIQQLR